MSASGGGGPVLPEWIWNLQGLANRIGSRGLVGAIVSIVLGTFVTMFIIRPVQYAIAFLEWGGALIDDSIGAAQAAIAAGFEPVNEAILGEQGVVDLIFGSIESSLVSAGLGAPFAATITAVVLAAVVTVLVYVLIRVAVDAIPGGGGLLP
jgi:hypothetical protein